MEKIVLENISKKIRGEAVLDNVNLVLEPGNVYGFVGRNGSGKTMLIRLLAGLIHQDQGSVFYGGEKVERLPEKVSIGLMLENIGLYPGMTLQDNLLYFQGIQGKKRDREEVEKTILRVGLAPGEKKKFRKYSLGMKQRGVLAQAILGRPELLLLDEPTNGLDEEGVELCRNIIDEEVKRGATALVVSHNEQDIQCLCGEIYQVSRGKIQKCKESASKTDAESV